MSINLKEITSLIELQISKFSKRIEISNDIGTVVSVGDDIAIVYGLEKVMLGELVVFPNNTYGMVMNLEEDSVGIITLGADVKIKEGDVVKRTGKVVEIPVGNKLLGRVVNALGIPIDNLGEIKSEYTVPIERLAPGIMARSPVDTPLETGILAIDSLIPIGRGQRELIIGDRQSGKTAIAIDTIINQKGKNVKCIYVAIGQKNSSVAKIVEKFKETGAIEYTTIINASASEASSLLYIAPFSGVSIAEEWAKKGEDVLIVFDDLSKHAISYRTLSLLLRRSPGREAYPGDIFYLHSRLLERCAKLNKEHGGGSITALPIIETQGGDISSYIPTNVISITDGQIFLSMDKFNAGKRPAVDVNLSVSRVGSAAQYKAMKKNSSSLKVKLASFNELQSFTQFGSDIDDNTKKILHHGEILMEILVQDQYSPMSFCKEVIYLFIVKNGFVDDLEVEEVKKFLEDVYDHLDKLHPDIIEHLNDSRDLKHNERAKLRGIINEYKHLR